MRLSRRIGLAVTIVVGALLVLTATAERGLEVMAVLLLISLLVARELTSAYTTTSFRGRYDVFIWSGLALFVLIVVRRIREILNL